MDQKTLLSLLEEAAASFGPAEALNHFFGPSVQIRLPFPGRLCRLSIDEMQLSVRSWNALRRAGIDTVDQLITVAAAGDLPRIRNLGRISLSEIKTRLMTLGFQALSPQQQRQFFEYVIDHNTPLNR